MVKEKKNINLTVHFMCNTLYINQILQSYSKIQNWALFILVNVYVGVVYFIRWKQNLLLNHLELLSAGITPTYQFKIIVSEEHFPNVDDMVAAIFKSLSATPFSITTKKYSGSIDLLLQSVTYDGASINSTIC